MLLQYYLDQFSSTRNHDYKMMYYHLISCKDAYKARKLLYINYEQTSHDLEVDFVEEKEFNKWVKSL